MKKYNVKTYLDEVKLSDLGHSDFDTVLGYIGKSYFPLSEKMISRIYGIRQKVRAGHVTTSKKLSSLKKLQNSAKSIPTFTKYNDEGLPRLLRLFGFSPGTIPLIVIAEGVEIYKFPGDIFSGVDQQGRRWTKPGNFIPRAHILHSKFRPELDKFALKVAEMIREPGADNKTKQKAIKFYFDESEKLLIKLLPDIKKAWEDQRVPEYESYNEVVLSKFKIKVVYAINFKETANGDEILEKLRIDHKEYGIRELKTPEQLKSNLKMFFK